eukprot:gene5596-8942_t
MSGTSSAYDSGRRQNCLSKDAWYMAMAVLASKRSKDPRTQVGCVIVDGKGVIVSVGYNGFPTGCPDTELPWAKEAESVLDTKFPYVCHAEMNAILNTNDQSVEGCTAYSTLFPCNECAKMIIQAGIRKVVYLCNKSSGKPSAIASQKMFDMAGVEYTKFDYSKSQSRISIDLTGDSQRDSPDVSVSNISLATNPREGDEYEHSPSSPWTPS